MRRNVSGFQTALPCKSDSFNETCFRMTKAQEVHIAPNRGRGVIARYREFLPVSESMPIVSLGEGGTPLSFCRRLSAQGRRGCGVVLHIVGLKGTASLQQPRM